MYVPVELDAEPEEKQHRKEWKLRREREFRKGREKARGVVVGWEETYNGKKNDGKYFEVGKVVGRDEKSLGPKRELCEQAQKARPKPE